MSRENIIGIDPTELSVTFALRDGETRTYFYSADDFSAISAGAEPSTFAGSLEPKSLLNRVVNGIADAVIDAREFGAL